jgi:ABC-type nitrate/sulfonate/bicarbonate transport system permease component
MVEAAPPSPPGARTRGLVRSLWTRRLVSLACVLVVWQLAVWLNTAIRFMNPALLPKPAGVLQAASEQIAEGFLHQDILYSLYRVLAGFLLGASVAVVLGCVSGSVRVIEDFLDPVLEMLRPIPPLAWLPLFIFWFGIGEPSKVYFTAFVAFFPVYVNTIEGVKYVDPVLRRAAASLGATRSQMFLLVTVQAALPQIITGLRLGFGMAFLALVATELIAANAGLGYRIMEARNYFKVDWMVFGALMIGVIGFTLGSLIRAGEARLLRWRARDEK